jgi:peptidoglycan/xylan/chitin deacetylase (PgdA/CDA1 family)
VTVAVTGAIVVAALLAAWFSHRYAWWRRSVDYDRPRILMYHMVSEHRRGAVFNKLRVPPAAFAAQLRWLRDDGWHFACMSALETPQALPRKTVILTFDDGYGDNLEAADPLLERYGACATLYLVEGRFDRDWSTSKKAHHDSGELMRERKLSDTEVESMLASGRWELGGHTRTHANLARAGDDERHEEIAAARRTLAARFDVPLTSFAYPFGIYGSRDIEAVRAAGFRTAVTTQEGIPEDPLRQALELPRIKVSGKEGLFAFRLRLRTGRRGA